MKASENEDSHFWVGILEGPESTGFILKDFSETEPHGFRWDVLISTLPNSCPPHFYTRKQKSTLMLRTMTLWGAGLMGLAERALKVDLGSQDCWQLGERVLFSTIHILWHALRTRSQLLSESKGSVGKSIREWALALTCSDLLFLVGRSHTNLNGNSLLHFYSHDQGLEDVCLRTHRMQNLETRNRPL